VGGGGEIGGGGKEGAEYILRNPFPITLVALPIAKLECP